MNAIQKRMNPWIVTIVMGVVVILFSVYTFQQQEELLEARMEIERLKTHLAEALSMADKNAEEARRNAIEATRQRDLALRAQRQADENLKN